MFESWEVVQMKYGMVLIGICESVKTLKCSYVDDA